MKKALTDFQLRGWTNLCWFWQLETFCYESEINSVLNENSSALKQLLSLNDSHPDKTKSQSYFFNTAKNIKYNIQEHPQKRQLSQVILLAMIYGNQKERDKEKSQPEFKSKWSEYPD